MDIDFVVLLDIYGGILSKGQREALDLRFNSDLTLSEIAEEMGGISRQSVNDFIQKGKRRLLTIEEAVGVEKRRKSTAAKLAEIKTTVAGLKNEYNDERFTKLEKALNELEESI